MRKRADFKQLQKQLNTNKLIFLDESGAKTNMSRLRGRSKGGTRLVDSTPHGHWCTTTMISAIRLDGTTSTMSVNSATDTDVFREYVRQVLCPDLREGDIVIMDNLPPHKDTESIKLIEGRGASVIFLPPYSPDFNPIEKMWSKIKEFLRAVKARTVDALHQAIGDALKTISEKETINWVKSCGYVIN